MIVLGSGLGPLADEVRNPVVIPYSDIPHFAQSTVPGHSGRFVIGELLGVPVGVMSLGLALEVVWLVATAAALAAAYTAARALRGAMPPHVAIRAAAKLAQTPGLMLAARAAVTLCGVLFAIVTNSAFTAVSCDSTVMTLTQYLLLSGDGSTASAALGEAAGLMRGSLLHLLNAGALPAPPPSAHLIEMLPL